MQSATASQVRSSVDSVSLVLKRHIPASGQFTRFTDEPSVIFSVAFFYRLLFQLQFY